MRVVFLGIYPEKGSVIYLMDIRFRRCDDEVVIQYLNSGCYPRLIMNGYSNRIGEISSLCGDALQFPINGKCLILSCACGG